MEEVWLLVGDGNNCPAYFNGGACDCTLVRVKPLSRVDCGGIVPSDRASGSRVNIRSPEWPGPSVDMRVTRFASRPGEPAMRPPSSLVGGCCGTPSGAGLRCGDIDNGDDILALAGKAPLAPSMPEAG